MSNRYKVIKEFLDSFAEFEAATKDEAEITFKNFLIYSAAENRNKTVIDHREISGDLEPEVVNMGNKKEESIAILVTYLFRYAKLYVKKALAHSPLQSIDDFSYLIILLTHQSLSKSELINKNVHEKTTGTEIIKRLIKIGLISQTDDINDKRSQRVSITDMGKGIIFSILSEMGDVSKLMSGNLSEREKEVLIYLLKKLDKFHFEIFANDRSETLQSILLNRVTNNSL